MPSKLENAFAVDSDLVHLHHAMDDFTSIQELPNSYKWTERDDNHSSVGDTDSFVMDSPPVIDFLDPNALKNIGHACKNWGAFQVINHGIPISLLDNIEYVSRSLFSLPFHQKLKAEKSPDGVSGYGRLRISSGFSKLMWSEGFTIVGSPLQHFRHLWPEDYPKFCNIIEEYQTEMHKLATRLMWLMLGPLGITREDIKWAGSNADFEGSSAVFQLIHYPVCPDPDLAMGLAAHTDSTLLTILYQNGTSGLQVLKEGTGWVTVPPIPGALVINVGDLLHILSNGLYPSITHRAVVNRNKDRLSMVYLYGPPSNAGISPLAKLAQPPLYRSVTWKEYLGIKAKLLTEALPSIRVSAPLDESVDANESNN